MHSHFFKEMRSHLVGLEVQTFTFIYLLSLCVRAENNLARLSNCADSSTIYCLHMLYVFNSHQLTHMNFEKATKKLNLHMAVLVGNEANESRSEGELTVGPKRERHIDYHKLVTLHKQMDTIVNTHYINQGLSIQNDRNTELILLIIRCIL